MTLTPRLNALIRSEQPYLTDGGFETSMLFHEGFDLPHFAAFTIMGKAAGLAAMDRYFTRFVEIAAKHKRGYVLDTNTWRAGAAWAPALGLSTTEMKSVNADAVSWARSFRLRWESRTLPIVINGIVGPAGDGYIATDALSAGAAQDTHAPQIHALAGAGVDMISALTITNAPEAVGIVRAAAAAHIPVVISFTLETDGRLPSGQTLADAIMEVDEATRKGPLYYMINCAHPDHFSDVVSEDAAWLARIGGVRANASRLSHAELDACETLDDGNPEEFGHQHAELARLLPSLKVVGGCCGTDHRHVGCVADHLNAPKAA
ncbi:homocysteine S-methyltransferase family protein [Litoreibacter roseus]|uniref:Homocysteine S-methyltransferase n=1 Tax=Litoreibacter roseus TaxID=2601869 RepID=A0A6N6JKS4_9RHOB|nr:homocysteine S-methyltransferase family protein [Litoreibacter roseus]GFE66923.1 homocysteine S-methyltransferase [Litoreibacter roseus]